MHAKIRTWNMHMPFSLYSIKKLTVNVQSFKMDQIHILQSSISNAWASNNFINRLPIYNIINTEKANILQTPSNEFSPKKTKIFFYIVEITLLKFCSQGI